MTHVASLSPRTESLLGRPLRRFARNHLAVLGLVSIVLILFLSIVGPSLIRYDQLFIDLRARFAPPLTGSHWLGTDPLGRDIAARLLMAGRVSLLVAFSSMLMSVLIGSSIGIVAGYYGGRIGAALMRVVDAFLCFPSIFLLLTLAAFVQPSPIMITVLIAATSWMEISRIVSAEVKSLREREFVLAARMAGLSGRWIMVRELLPNVIGPIIVAATLTVARAILSEAYISFLGYGIQPPAPSWGNMLNGAQQYLSMAPWLAIIPGLMITWAVTSFNFIGDGLRDALDARSEQ
ncbi:ABC transporter permease [Labrys wisconsinensis]|jgi:peptide/nickel transport system permease protein|uniref:Peptide/nickel transport system permease protein n=1 Tax=Labrys wisconsinensis TaxID=425677 RepID=A0ABU0JK07_9HYPH|nr:ABC transporter permease [Labrys wisconsinensis]MDQ0473462.1 peptide/nickel transport system permease protein [Labrys wisconsinensis]